VTTTQRPMGLSLSGMCGNRSSRGCCERCPGHDRGTALVLWQSENRVLTFRSQEASTETPLLRIWDSEDGRLLDEPISGRQGAAAATLLTGGQSLLLARYPGSISLWSTTTWQQQWQSALDYDVVYDLCQIPNTSFTLIAAGNNDATSAAIYLLDSQSFELQHGTADTGERPHRPVVDG
jgi:hypothetical protein